MIIERTCYVPKPGVFDQVLAVRRRACEVRRALGLPAGTIRIAEPHARAADGAGGTAFVEWELAFADEAAQRADLAARDASPEFTVVRQEIGALIDRFQRCLIRADRQSSSVLRDVALDGLPIAPQEVHYDSNGLSLAAFLYLPPGDGPFACIVFNHGSSIAQGTTDLCRPGTAAVLMKWGLAVLMPHRRGYGNSPGTPWREEVSAKFGTADYDRQLAGRLAAEARDVIAAHAFAAAHPSIDADHIGVMGSSFGGVVTLLAAAEAPQFRCAVEFAGAAINWEKTPGLRALMHEAAGRLSQPIFFAQAENDYSTRPTVELSQGLAGSAKVVAARVYPRFGLTRDEGHFLCGQGAAVWGRDVREFLERWL